ncbi:restriction endonuclease [Methylocystis heyeri]|uniref:Restriction endonuclease n=1 Tax=Methylocystis heyeri TaxID=391905 RepID=A0A6B8KDV1_9HYPH|nr:restriction endonuclease [Methylocystis heyeri]QGM45857.1 restriction endonuclease [Methylocystis heyeri]
MPRRPEPSSAIAACVAWILFFLVAAGFFWPRAPGLACMGLSFAGLLHLAVLSYEEVTQAKFDEDMSPIEFEHYCAQVLREMKWDARVTQASGDQGVDIIADKRGRRIVVQCKKYSKPVGNRAVQEIVAAIAHVDAERGVVVATCDYTPAAQRLAASNDVLLLRHTELRKIDRLLTR